MQTTTINTSVTTLAQQLSVEFFQEALQRGDTNSFPVSNYNKLRQLNLFAALIPEELGGSGWRYADMCYFLKEIAKGCPSTALAFSMHQHLVAANVWKYKQGQGSEEMLRKVAVQQPVLVSTGANDWLSSTGTMIKVDGGYEVTARKNFASQSPVGDILVTSAQYDDPVNGTQVLHFSVPFSTAGISVDDNWNALGMRSTASCSVKLTRVYVPENAVVLKRPAGEFHTFWNVVLTVAMPLIMSVYTGIAEKAAELTMKHVSDVDEMQVPFLLGEMHNNLTTARVMLESMIAHQNDFDFKPANELGNAMLVRKTIIANSGIQVLQNASALYGGKSYLKAYPIEKLYRDILAVHFHPLPEKEQHYFTGTFLQTGQPQYVAGKKSQSSFSLVTV